MKLLYRENHFVMMNDRPALTIADVMGIGYYEILYAK